MIRFLIFFLFMNRASANLSVPLNMISDIAAIILPIFLVISLGQFLIGRGWMTDGDNQRISWFVFHVAAPALLFRSIALFDFFRAGAEIIIPVAVIYGVSSFFAFSVLLATRFLGPSRSGVLAQGSFRSNMVFIALPIITGAFPGNDHVLAVLSLVIGLTIPLYNFLAIIVLSLSASALEERSILDRGKQMAKGTLLNPLILSSISGLVFSMASLSLPGPVDRSLEMVGQIAGPLALISIGMSLRLKNIFKGIALTGVASFMKLVLYPGLVFSGMLLLVPNDPVLIQVAVLLASAPTAIVSHIMAKEMGGDSDLSSGIVVLTTTLSLLTISLWLILFRLLSEGEIFAGS